MQVIAENERKKYKLNITRRELSNNTDINVSVNNKKIIFEQNETYIKLENIEKIDYKYELEDQNASVIVEGKPELEYGDNIIKFLVTSESGSTNEYRLVINRCNDEDKESKKESKNDTYNKYWSIRYNWVWCIYIYKKENCMSSKFLL